MDSKSTKILAGIVSVVIIAILVSAFLIIDSSSDVVSQEVKKKLREESFARVLIKSSTTLNIILDGESKSLYLDIEDSTPLEIKQIAGDYYSVEVNSKDLNNLVDKISLDKVILDDTFDLLIEESKEITKINEVYDLGYTGNDVRICVIDTGVNSEVLGLKHGENLFGHNIIENSEDFSDDNGHGTKVMSILSSVAPDADFYIAKAINAEGNGYASDVGAAVEWCVSKNVDVISMSIGTGDFEGICDNDFVAQIVNDVVYDGTHVFAATGNDGDNLVSSPACSGLTIPVASSSKSDVISNFSNFNENTFIVAPGEGISVVNNLGEKVIGEGTSLSTPMVAGIAALHLEKSNIIDPLSLEIKIIRSGDIIEKDGKKFVRINALNLLTDNLINDLSRSDYGYGNWDAYKVLEEEEGPSVTGEDSTFEILELECSIGEDCAKAICIEGICQEACNSTYMGDRCSNDGSAYTTTGGGTCAANNAGSYICDKDEVSYTNTLPHSYWTDCYEIESGAPGEEYLCDSDVAPNFIAEGVCSISTGAPSVINVNCDTDEVCVDSSSYYRSACGYCGYTSERECDSDADDGGYAQDGICVYSSLGSPGGMCGTGAVCLNSSGSYIINASIPSECVDNDPCDSDVNPGYVNDGIVCNTESLYCVANGSRTTGQSCCEDSNCNEIETCTGSVCTAAASDCPAEPGEFASSSNAVFEIKNSTGQVCFAVNDSGAFVIAGTMHEGCEYASGGNVFEVTLVNGASPVTINESCDFCAKGQIVAENASLTCDVDSFCVKNNSDITLLKWNNDITNFYGGGCYGYNTGSPTGVQTS